MIKIRAVPADHRVKLKENKKKDKYLDLARELKKKLWNMKVTMTPIGAFGIVKILVHRLEYLVGWFYFMAYQPL